MIFNTTGSKMHQMVSWFNLKQLAHTAFQSVISKLIGGQADRRLMLALASTEKEFYDYTHHHKVENGRVVPAEGEKRKELWLDFIADTGDGWDSTYSVAYYAAKPELDINSGKDVHHTKRGEVLIFGGDEVYPTP